MERLLLNLLVSDNATIQEVRISRYSLPIAFVKSDSLLKAPWRTRAFHPIGCTLGFAGRSLDARRALLVSWQSDLQFVSCLLFCLSIVVIRCSIQTAILQCLSRNGSAYQCFRFQATKELKKVLQNPDSVPALCQLVVTSKSPEVRDLFKLRELSRYVFVRSSLP